MRNFEDKTFKQNQNTHFMINPPPPPLEIRAVYDITW